MEHLNVQKILEKWHKLYKNLHFPGWRFIGIAGVLTVLIPTVWSLFSSETALQNFLSNIGPAAPLLFLGLQTMQTVVPFIPATLIIPIGLLLFGVSTGFFLSFLGLTLGSIINFRLARHFGRPFVEKWVNGKQLDKYTEWLEDEEHFDRLFAFGMFFPFTPSDLLCYLAGLSDISFKKYLSITSTSKIFTLFLYAYGFIGLLRVVLPFLAN